MHTLYYPINICLINLPARSGSFFIKKVIKTSPNMTVVEELTKNELQITCKEWFAAILSIKYWKCSKERKTWLVKTKMNENKPYKHTTGKEQCHDKARCYSPRRFKATWAQKFPWMNMKLLKAISNVHLSLKKKLTCQITCQLYYLDIATRYQHDYLAIS